MINSIVTILEDILTGDPLKDTIIIGICFTIFRDFYTMFFGAMFSIFKR